MANRMRRWFVYGHLPENLQVVPACVEVLVDKMDDLLDEGAEKTAGMRKLLEAKDCFVRAKIETDEKEESDAEAAWPDEPSG